MSRQLVRSVFTAGPLIQANSPNGVAISTGSDMKPGDVRVGIMRINNFDSLPQRFRLSELDASSDFGAGELRLGIADAESEPQAPLFSDEFGAVHPEGIDLGDFEAGEERTFFITLSCSVDAAGAGLGRVASATYVWSTVPRGEGDGEAASRTSPGRLVRARFPGGAVVVASPDLKPGEGQSGEVAIANLDTQPAVFRLYERGAGSGFAAGRLGLAIHQFHEGEFRRLFLGEIGGVPREGIDLGRLEAGESRTYRLSVVLAKETPEEELGRAAGAIYHWQAIPLGG